MGRPHPGPCAPCARAWSSSDGPTAPAEVGVLAPGVLRLVIHEGRNRQVRRMCDAVGHPVQRLVRTRIGPVRDTNLPPGRWRALDADEVRSLAASAQPSPRGREAGPERPPTSEGAEEDR